MQQQQPPPQPRHQRRREERFRVMLDGHVRRANNEKDERMRVRQAFRDKTQAPPPGHWRPVVNLKQPFNDHLEATKRVWSYEEHLTSLSFILAVMTLAMINSDVLFQRPTATEFKVVPLSTINNLNLTVALEFPWNPLDLTVHHIRYLAYQGYYKRDFWFSSFTWIPIEHHLQPLVYTYEDISTWLQERVQTISSAISPSKIVRISTPVESQPIVPRDTLIEKPTTQYVENTIMAQGKSMGMMWQRGGLAFLVFLIDFIATVAVASVYMGMYYLLPFMLFALVFDVMVRWPLIKLFTYIIKRKRRAEQLNQVPVTRSPDSVKKQTNSAKAR